MHGPSGVGKICDAAELTTEQRGPVALIARDMRVAYDAEVARRAALTESQLRAEGIGASEHAKQEALARHRDLLQRLRESPEKASTCEAETEDAKQTSWNEVGVELVTDENPNCACMGPVDLAKYLCDAAELTTEQR